MNESSLAPRSSNAREAGDHVLSCRATDTTGDTQPPEQRWNYQGMGNSLAQEVDVTVR